MATTMARSGPVVEITFELPAHTVAVLDGYCQAHNLPRTAGNNPDAPGSGRD